jgi:Zn-dependent protease
VTSSAVTQNCPSCGAEVAPGLLACPGCARLIHADELSHLARDAEAAERTGDLTTALATWRRAIGLLPPQTRQRAAIDERMRGLSAAIDGRGPLPPGVARKGKGRGRVAAGAGVLGVLLLKSKALLVFLLANAKLLVLGLLNLPTLLSAYVFWRLTPSTFGFGLGVVACIYVHEMGHVAALRRYGIDASAPMFIPGLGALIRLKQYPTDAFEDARTGLAGPLWGLFASAAAIGLGRAFGWSTAVGVGSLSASINLFNLVPVWQLDGSRGWRALSRFERAIVAATAGVVALVLHQPMPLLVAGVGAVRTLGADAHPTGDRRVFWLFVALLIALGALATFPLTRGPLPHV